MLNQPRGSNLAGFFDANFCIKSREYLNYKLCYHL